jgi:phenylacetate-coenzyme A ligase PaaK-like adenylate-forming protein
MNPHETKQATLRQLNGLFAHCRNNSSYYRGRLPEQPFTSLDELQQVPVMTQAEFRAHLPPEGEGGLAGPLEATYAFASGGTTGHPKLVYYAARELDQSAADIAYGLQAAGVRPGMVAANLMNAGNLWGSFQMINLVLEKCRCHILPIAAQSGPEEALNFMRVLGAEVAIGIPSFMISLAQQAQKLGVTDLHLKIMATGGEHFLDQAKAFVKPILNVQQFVSAGYSSNDTGPIGYQCSHCNGGIHHLFQEHCILEVLNEETLLPMPVGEAGKLVVTKLQNRLMPIIRYDIGDRGRIVGQDCPCGRTEPLFELLGRSDDILNIGGYNVSPDHLASVLAKVAGLSPHFRMIARNDGPRALLYVECESVAPCSADEAEQWSDILQYEIVETLAGIRALLNLKSIATPRFAVLQPGSIPRNPRTGKIRRVIDERTI